MENPVVSKFKHGEITEDDLNQYNKALILGIVPIIDSNGCIVDVKSDKVVFNNATNVVDVNIQEPETTAIFNGCRKIGRSRAYSRKIYNKLYFKEVIINNPQILENIFGKDDLCSPHISAPIVVINHNQISIKTVE